MMKKLSKIFVCIALVLCTTFGLTACSVGEVEENTRKAVETTTSIIPVEYTKETAEGIFNNALYNLFKEEKVNLEVKQTAMDGVSYVEFVMTQKILIQNGKRYIYLDSKDYYPNADLGDLVIGIYGENDKKFLIDVASKKYAEIPNIEEPEDPDLEPGEDTIVSVPEMIVDILGNLDIVSSFSALSECVVSGRYFNGSTYINLKFSGEEQCSSAEVKIVDGKIVSMSVFTTEESIVAAWGTCTFTYGDAVDVSKIPTTLTGLTESTLDAILQTTPVS